jgi:uncharacterized protein
MSPARSAVIDVFELARERRSVEGEIPVESLPRLAASLLRHDGVLAYAIRGEVDDRGHPGAEMRLSADLSLECQRCNQELVYPLRRDARFRFVDSEYELNALPIEEDEVDAVVGSRHMDVVAWVEDEAILSLPLVPRHDHCVPDIAQSAGEGGKEVERPNPFAALAGLKGGRKPG